MSNEGTFVIGRDSSADIVVADDTVGRRHAEIVVTNGKFFLVDLNSANGVYQILDDGQEVRFARGWVAATDRFALGRFEATIADLLHKLPHARLAELGVYAQIASAVSAPNRTASSPAPVAVSLVDEREQAGKRVRCLSCGNVFMAADNVCPSCSTPRKR